MEVKNVLYKAESKLRAIELHGLDNLKAQIAIEEVADLLAQICEAHKEEIAKSVKEERDRCAQIAIGYVRKAIMGD